MRMMVYGARAICLALICTLAHAAPIKVVASFSILGDLAHSIGGEHIELTTLVGANGDTHVYQPSPQDVRKVSEAQVLVLNGLGFEGWQMRLLQASRFKGVQIVASVGIQALLRNGIADPHAWHDPKRLMTYVRNIQAGLSKADPAHATLFASRADGLIAAIQQQDEQASKQFAALSATQRRAIVQHDSLAYLAQRYTLTLLPAQGISTESEPSARDIAQLVRQVRTSGIQAVFIESIANPRLMEQIGREAGLKPGGKLYTDALSAPGQGADHVVDMLRYNVSTLVSAMQANRASTR
ncbi:zinc ABC transporter substrate-binding protein [Burkholderiaceae bacterium DAT-1]|nr:zinc ABC transporter substrate-binding protein [Burkholderiaceae bacterium DAT-1]